MNILNNLTGLPAILVALTAAIMWGTWFISLKYLKDYPIEAFYVAVSYTHLTLPTICSV